METAEDSYTELQNLFRTPLVDVQSILLLLKETIEPI